MNEIELLREAQRCLSFSAPMSILYERCGVKDMETLKQLSLEINNADLAIRKHFKEHNLPLDPRNNSLSRTDTGYKAS